MKEQHLLQRRSFLKKASMVALAFPVLDFGIAGIAGCTSRSPSAEAAVGEGKSKGSWKIVTVSDKEPGTPLIVSGTVYAPDGRTPQSGAKLFVYQTDATGVYTTSGGDNRGTRIHGEMVTGSDGRYEFRTIKPGSYPNSNIPAHIHAHLSAPEFPEYWIDEYWFSDDPFVPADAKQKSLTQGRFAAVLTLTKGDDGILRGVRDIKLERCSQNCV